MNRRLILSSLLAVLALPAAHAVEYGPLLPEKSSITFTSKQMGVAVDGHFRKFAATIAFDPARPTAASARIAVDLASIDAGSPDADNEVAGKPWFNTRVFPTASFVSSSVRVLGNDHYEALGKISIKGRTQDAVLPFTVRQDGSTASFDGNLTIKRLDFAIGEGAWADTGTVANEVQVRFRLVTTRK